LGLFGEAFHPGACILQLSEKRAEVREGWIFDTYQCGLPDYLFVQHRKRDIDRSRDKFRGGPN
jgi:hypothetical protein